MPPSVPDQLDKVPVAMVLGATQVSRRGLAGFGAPWGIAAGSRALGGPVHPGQALAGFPGLGDHHPADRRRPVRARLVGCQDRRIHRPPARQHPGLLHDLAYRVVDPVRPLGPGKPPPPVHQRRRVEARLVDRQPAGHLPPHIETGPPRRSPGPNSHTAPARPGSPPSAWPAATAGPPPAGRTSPRNPRRGTPRPGARPGTRHAARRHQMPGQHLRVQKLPVCPLETLHETITPGHRAPSRQTHHYLGPFQQAPRRVCW